MKTKAETTILLHPSRQYGGENNDLYLIDNLSSAEMISCRELCFPGDSYIRAGHAIVGSYLYLIGGRLPDAPRFCTNTIRRLNLSNPVELEIFELPFYCHTNPTAVVGDLIYIFAYGLFQSDSDCNTFVPDPARWGYIWDTKNQIGKYLEAPPNVDESIDYCVALDETRVLILSNETCFLHTSIEDQWEEWESLKLPDRSKRIWSHAVSEDGTILYLFWTSICGKGFLSGYNLDVTTTGGAGGDHLIFELEIPSIEKRCWFSDGYCASSGDLFIDCVQLVALGNGNKFCFLDYSAYREDKLFYTRIALEEQQDETVVLVIQQEKKIDFDVKALVDF